MFIEEIKQDLTGRRLDIWRGHDDAGQPVLTPDQCEDYRRLWRRQAGIAQEVVRPAQPPRKPCNCGKTAA